MKLKSYCIVVALIASGLTPSASHAGWSFQDIYVAGSLQTRATDINDAGTIVGYYQPSVNTPLGESADLGFVIQNGIQSSIPITDPWGINNSGTIVGFTIAAGAWHGQIFSNGVLTQVDVAGAVATTLYDINDAGVAVGTYWYETPAGTQTQVFTYQDGNINLIDVPDSTSTSGWRIDNSGAIYGLAVSSSGQGTSFGLTSDGTVFNVDYVAAGTMGTTYMWGANDVGQSIGFSPAVGNGDRSYVYANNTFTPLDHPDTSQTQAYGINNSGNVVGLWWDFSNNIGHGFLATPTSGTDDGFVVPEASTVSLGLLAAGMMYLGRRRSLHSMSDRRRVG